MATPIVRGWPETALTGVRELVGEEWVWKSSLTRDLLQIGIAGVIAELVDAEAIVSGATVRRALPEDDNAIDQQRVIEISGDLDSFAFDEAVGRVESTLRPARACIALCADSLLFFLKAKRPSVAVLSPDTVAELIAGRTVSWEKALRDGLDLVSRLNG